MSLPFNTGPCCLQQKCQHADGELRPCHTCTQCHEIVHLQCAEIDPDTDAWTCMQCTGDASETETEDESVDKDKEHSKSQKKKKGKDVLQEMTVNVQPMNEEFTTITDSVKDKAVKYITKDYFVTKGQRVNTAMRDLDSDWEDLKTKVKKTINSALKEEMVVEAQRLKLTYSEKNQDVMVENFREIGKSWKMDGSLENAKKINQVAYGVFDAKKNEGHDYYLERSIMKEMNLEYTNSNKGRGCIASMISRRKADLAKNIMKRAELTHQTKISKKRTHEQTEKEGLRNKKPKFAFQIKGHNGNYWYNTDGSKNDDDLLQDEESTKLTEYKQKIKDLEKKLSVAKKVLFFVTFNAFFNVFVF